MEVFVAFPITIAMEELCLRLNGRAPAYDLSHERKERCFNREGRWNATVEFNEYIFATIDRPVDGRIERHARTLRFGDHLITEISLTHL